MSEEEQAAAAGAANPPPAAAPQPAALGGVGALLNDEQAAEPAANVGPEQFDIYSEEDQVWRRPSAVSPAPSPGKPQRKRDKCWKKCGRKLQQRVSVDGTGSWGWTCVRGVVGWIWAYKAWLFVACALAAVYVYLGSILQSVLKIAVTVGSSPPVLEVAFLRQDIGIGF